MITDIGKLDPKVFNHALTLYHGGIPIDKIEAEVNIKILHKLFPILKEYKHDTMPTKVTSTEIQIILGKLREYELQYRTQKKWFEKGQKRLFEFTKEEEHVKTESNIQTE